MRTSGTVPGEHTVGQTRLTVQLVVGSQRTASRSGWDLLYGFMMSLRHEVMRFTSRCRQHHSKHSKRCCGHRGRKPHIPKGGGTVAKSGGLRNQGLVQLGQPEAWGIPQHTVTLSPRLVPDAPSALYYKRYMNKYGVQL